MRNKLIALGVVMGACALSFFFVRQSITPHTETASLLDTTNTNPLTESLPDATATAEAVPAPQENNVTDVAAKKLADSLIKKNSDGLLDTANGPAVQTIDPQKVVDDMLSEGMKNFDPSVFNPPVIASKIKFTPTDTPADKIVYSGELQNILTSNFLSSPLNTNSLQIEDFQTLMVNAEKAVNALYDVPVPQSLLSVHIKEIRLASSMREIFKAVTNSDTDPLAAVFAVRLLPDISSEWAKASASLNQILASATH